MGKKTYNVIEYGADSTGKVLPPIQYRALSLLAPQTEAVRLSCLRVYFSPVTCCFGII